MGFYIRKSLSVGPVRFNLSKSGVGVSVGVKGVRVGVNAKGKTYVHAGRGGLYYRANLGGKKRGGKEVPGRRGQNKEAAVVEAGGAQPLEDGPGEREIFQHPQIHAGEPGAFTAPPALNPALALILPLFRSLREKHERQAGLAAAYSQELSRLAQDLAALPETLPAAIVSIAGQFPLSRSWRAWARETAYETVLARIMTDGRVSPEEAAGLVRFQQALEISNPRALELRTAWFKTAYLSAVADREVSAEEDAVLMEFRSRLGVREEELEGERETIARFRKIREALAGELSPLPVELALEPGESCFFNGPVRVLRPRSTGRGWAPSGPLDRYFQVEKEGTLAITSARLFFPGTVISLDLVAEIEADADLNLLVLALAGQASSLYLSSPESLLAGAILNRMTRSS
jgi:hypothetical protein